MRVVLYRDIQRVKCSYAVVFAINERLKCNAFKGCMKVYNIMHDIFAMLPFKRNHTSISFKGKYKS